MTGLLSGTITPTGKISPIREPGGQNHAGSRYASGAYEISHSVPVAGGDQKLGEAMGTIAAYGPWWGDFRASLLVDDRGSDQEGEGMVFRLNDKGYYLVLLTRIGKPRCSFKLVKKILPPTFSAPGLSPRETVVIPWTENEHSQDPVRQSKPGKMTQKQITVECKGEQITIWLDDTQVGRINDDSLLEGYVGMAQFGYGRALFRDLQVQSLP